MTCYCVFLYHELLQGNGVSGALESCRGLADPSSLKIPDVNFYMREERIRHYFLEWSLCHTCTRIGCGLFVKELWFHSALSLGGHRGHLFWSPFFLEPNTSCRLSEGVDYLRTCFQLLVLWREVQLIWDVGYTCKIRFFFRKLFIHFGFWMQRYRILLFIRAMLLSLMMQKHLTSQMMI